MQNKYNCPVDATISKIGGKYKAVILYHLGNNTLRYNQIHKKIPAITDKMLAQQLRELENDNLIIKKIYPVIPPVKEHTQVYPDRNFPLSLSIFCPKKFFYYVSRCRKLHFRC